MRINKIERRGVFLTGKAGMIYKQGDMEDLRTVRIYKLEIKGGFIN